MGRRSKDDLLNDKLARQHLRDAFRQIEANAILNPRRDTADHFPLSLMVSASDPPPLRIVGRTLRQSWKRWTRGTHAPSQRVASRLLADALKHKWLKLRHLDSKPRKTVGKLLAANSEKTSPILKPWTPERPLGRFQPCAPSEMKRWQRDLQFATNFGGEFANQLMKEAGLHQQSTSGAFDEVRWLALFRAAFTEIAAATLEGLSTESSKHLTMHPHWPSALKMTGDDICSMFYAVARSVDTTKSPNQVISVARSSLLQHPEQEDADVKTYRLRRWVRD